MDSKKRERGKNYTEVEKFNLLDAVSEYLHIIENKKTDDVNSKLKKNIWDLIANKYNAIQQTGLRTGVQLKLLYENIKQKAKKDKADEKVEIYKTGGGTFVKKVDGLSEKFLRMNQTAVVEIPNKYDSSALFDVNYLPIDIQMSDSQIEILPSTSMNPSSKFRSRSPISEASLHLNQSPSSPSAAVDTFSKTTVPSTVPLPAPTISKIVKTGLNKKKKETYAHKEKEDIKLEILKVRLEKEIIEKDILLLKKQEKYLKLKEKKMKLKILAKKEKIQESDSSDSS